MAARKDKKNIEITANDKENGYTVQKPNLDVNKSLREEDTIDLLALFFELLNHIWVIIGVTILFGGIAGAYSYYGIAPTYSATTKLYVVSASGDSVVDLADLNIGTSLTHDYEELLTSYPVVNAVISEMKLPYDRQKLGRMTSITNPDNTRILNITITSTDPEEAMNIANKYAEVAIKYLPETMSTNAPNIAQKAIMPDRKVAPSNSKNTIIGAMIGAFLICGYFTVGYLLDDTFHSSEDIEAYYGIVPLAVVPEASELSVKKRKRKHRILGSLRKRFKRR